MMRRKSFTTNTLEHSNILDNISENVLMSPSATPSHAVAQANIQLADLKNKHTTLLSHLQEPLPEEIQNIIINCLKKRPPIVGKKTLSSETGFVFEYMQEPDRIFAPQAEVFYTNIPGISLAAFTIHPKCPIKYSQEISASSNKHTIDLYDPPLGHLANIWRAPSGESYIEHCGKVHFCSNLALWSPIQFPELESSGIHHMLGRQADGNIYFYTKNQLWRTQKAEAELVMVGDFSTDRLPCIHHSGMPMILHQQMLITGTSENDHHPIRLWNSPSDSLTAQSHPKIKNVLFVGNSDTALLLDVKGHIYYGLWSKGQSLDAYRIPLKIPEGYGHGWSVKNIGIGPNDSVYVHLEDTNGRQMSLHSKSDPLDFKPSFLLDRPLIVMHTHGLHQPQDDEIQSQISIDGHAFIGHNNGVLHYRPDSASSWDVLRLRSTNSPLTGIQDIYRNPKGFIDRRGHFALLDDAQTVVELKLHGRTTWLPSIEAFPNYPPGGPLLVSPDKVTVQIEPLAQLPSPATKLAVFSDRTTVALTTHGQVITITPDNTTHTLPEVENPLSIAIGLDDRLYVLFHPHNALPQILRWKKGDENWERLTVTWPSGALANDLQTRRQGQIAVKCGTQWHGLLPSMTTKSGLPSALRIDPEICEDESPAQTTLTPTNQCLNERQSSRISTRNYDAGISATLLGTLSTDPLTPSSVTTTFAESVRSQAMRLAKDVVLGSMTTSLRQTAQFLGIPTPATEQQIRLRIFYDQAKKAITEGKALCNILPAMAQVHIGQAVSPQENVHTHLTAAQKKQLLTMREQCLDDLLNNLRKICFHEGLITGDLGFTSSNVVKEDTTVTTTYWLAEKWRRLRSASQNTLNTCGFYKPEDLLPELRRGLHSLEIASNYLHQNLTPYELDTISLLYEITKNMMKAHVQLPAEDGHTPTTQRSHGLRTACIMQGIVQYIDLLQVTDAGLLEEQIAQQQSNKLVRLARLGMTSWPQFEAFDDVLTTFRKNMAQSGSVERLQLLKSLGLPVHAKRDQMAARLADLLQDLFNRTTYFSVQSQSAELRAGVNGQRWTHTTGISLGVSGERIHALGVERIGDSKDGDAGLVAFFVRHAKGAASATSGLGIDFKPGQGTGTYTYNPQNGENAVTANWGGSGYSTLAGACQHGKGAAVIIAPDKIPEFARILFDIHDTDTTNALAVGVNGGAIGLDLFETNLNAWAGINVNITPASHAHSFGLPQPHVSQKTAKTTQASAPTAAAASPLRDTLSSSVSSSTNAQGGIHWAQMELHLDHAWQKIIGLEYQGRLMFNADSGTAINIANSLSQSIGNSFRNLINLSTNNGSLQLAGIRVSSNQVQLPGNNFVKSMQRPFMPTGTYKRTLDTLTAHPVTEEEWFAICAKLQDICPDSKNTAEIHSFPTKPSTRLDVIEKWVNALQGGDARAIEQEGALEGENLELQRVRAKHATQAAMPTLWKTTNEIERGTIIDMLHQLRQQDIRASQHRAHLIPGVRVEFNLVGRESLERVLVHTIGHLGLGRRMEDLAGAHHSVAGLDQVLACFQRLPKINQVRFVCEMRPQARIAINDALIMHEEHIKQGIHSPESSNLPTIDWRTVLTKARDSADLYRLAAVIVHNTDDNPTSTRVGLPLASVSTTGTVSHQLFAAELQLRYGLYDVLEGIEVLEAGSRALSDTVHAFEDNHLKIIPSDTIPGETPIDSRSPSQQIEKSSTKTQLNA